MKAKKYFYLPMGIVLFLLSFVAYATSPHLQDNAKVVSQDMAGKLEKELGVIESSDGLHIEVVILPNFYNRQPEAVVNAFNEQLAKNAPEISKRALLVIVTSTGDVELRTTPNINAAFDAKNVKDITDNIKIKLNEKNYDEMARIGIAGVYHYYQQKFPSKSKEVQSSGKKIFNIVLFIIILVGVVFMVRAMPKKPTDK